MRTSLTRSELVGFYDDRTTRTCSEVSRRSRRTRRTARLEQKATSTTTVRVGPPSGYDTPAHTGNEKEEEEKEVWCTHEHKTEPSQIEPNKHTKGQVNPRPSQLPPLLLQQQQLLVLLPSCARKLSVETAASPPLLRAPPELTSPLPLLV